MCIRDSTYTLKPGHIFGTITYASYTVTYTPRSDHTLVRTVNGGSPVVVARDVDVEFLVSSASYSRYVVTMDITALVDHGDDVEKSFKIHPRCTGE